MLQHEAGHNIFGLQQMPMDFCGAETQGAIAYMIETAMDRVLYENGMTRRVISLVTRVEVNPKDPMFQNPTKPVGPFYTAEEAQRLAAETGAVYKEDPQGRGWRKVVPSPKPVHISNIDLVGRLAREGKIVVTCGGGGIPVVWEKGGYKGVEAVIDKDLASALCACQIRADALYILTDVPEGLYQFPEAGGEGPRRDDRRPGGKIPGGRPVRGGVDGPEGPRRHPFCAQGRQGMHHHRSRTAP
jgi:Carbamate kinase